jgi:hypothetical protein
MKLNHRSFTFQRLSNQHIAGKKFEKPEQVVKRLGALQAQDYMQSLWAIGLRTQSVTSVDIKQAIADKKIVLTWPMRGTLHFVPAEDTKWMLKLSAPRTLAQSKRRMEQLGLNLEIIERCKQIIYDTLHGNKRLSRPDVMKLLEDASISTKNQRGYHILWHIAQTGLICLGPMEDKKQTVVLLDEWVLNSRELSTEESLAELAVRYFTGHGPATIHDFAWWAGITITDARLGIQAAQPGLQREKINDHEHWMSKDTPSEPTYEKPAVYLLPGFDEYLLGYKDRSAVLASEHASLVVPGNNGIFLPIIVIDGQVVGTWKRIIKKNGVDITFNSFAPLGDHEGSVIEAAHRYSEFIGLPLSMAMISQ